MKRKIIQAVLPDNSDIKIYPEASYKMPATATVYYRLARFCVHYMDSDNTLVWSGGLINGFRFSETKEVFKSDFDKSFFKFIELGLMKKDKNSFMSSNSVMMNPELFTKSNIEDFERKQMIIRYNEL